MMIIQRAVFEPINILTEEEHQVFNLAVTFRLCIRHADGIGGIYVYDAGRVTVELALFIGESEGGFERRVRDYAEEMYNEYCADAEACGYFGFDKINISNDKVPSKLNVNFGTMNEGSTDNFVTKVNTFFATDADHNITQKQLDSVELVKNGALKHMGSSLKAYMESTYDVDKETSVWDVCTPKTLIVPKGNADSFCVVVEYTNEVTGKNEYFGWTAPVSNTDDTITMESCEKFNMESFINETQYENHDKFIQEQKDRISAVQDKVKGEEPVKVLIYDSGNDGVFDSCVVIVHDIGACKAVVAIEIHRPFQSMFISPAKATTCIVWKTAVIVACQYLLTLVFGYGVRDQCPVS